MELLLTSKHDHFTGAQGRRENHSFRIIDNIIVINFSSSVSGLVVKFVVAIDEPGVRFPPDAKRI